MSTQRLRKWLLRSGLVLLAIVLLGYASNAMTARASEQLTKAWTIQCMSEWQNNWPGRVSSTEPATSWIPWLQGVPYHWQTSPDGAEWGTRYYFTFFGQPFVGWHRVEMQA